MTTDQATGGVSPRARDEPDGRAPGVRRRIGLLGGTFDPPHVGHLIVAECARVALSLAEVRLLVAGDPWMKQTAAAAPVRSEMVCLAVADAEGIVGDDRETVRSGPTYTADTLRQLHDSEPDVDWVFLLGDDAAASLPRWHDAAALADLAEFVVVAREGHNEAGTGGGAASAGGGDDAAVVALLGGPPQRLEIPTIDVSSSDIRDRYRTGQATRYMVPAAVDDLIRRVGLYGCHEAGRTAG